MKFVRFILAITILFAAFRVVPAAHAFEVESGEMVDVSRDQVIDGSLFIGAKSVKVDGVVHGDVYCAGNDVTISGTVEGDVICAAQMLRVSGVVDGNLRLAGQTITIEGPVKRNVTAFGQTLTQSQASSVSGELFVAAQTLTQNGIIGKSLGGYGETIGINGKVHGNVDVETSSLILGDSAKVYGNLHYVSDTKVVVPKSASILGMVTNEPTAKQNKQQAAAKPAPNPWPANAIPSILFFLVVGLLMLKFMPAVTQKIFTVMKEDPIAVALKGFVYLMVVPVVAVILAVTIIGIPFALLLVLLYIIAIAISRLFVALWVGWYILDSFKAKTKDNTFLQIAVGVPVLWFMFKAPFVGGIVGFLAVIWGLGGMVQMVRSKKK
ncbi:MAG TPA: polymer-forming cytoskeletal protein [Patescibacteria group bacterium]|nr:polymer-forming cytoskeletal protein [Patescibacteria group bacterium]